MRSTQRSDYASISALLAERAREHPDRLAYLFLENGEHETARLTYGDLDRRARQIAETLRGIAEPGDRALLLYPSGLEFICAFMGCLYAGVIAVPAFPPRRNRNVQRLRAIVSDAGAKVGLTSKETCKNLEMQAAGFDSLLQIRFAVTDGETAHETSFTPLAVGRDTLAFLQYTSGSTGTPKGVMVSHGNLLANLEVIRLAAGYDDTTIFLGWLPLFHDMGLIGNVLVPLYLGIHSVLMDPAAFIQKPVRWLRAITKYRATSSGGPNSAYELCRRKISAEQKIGLDLSTWSVAFNGAEPIRTDTMEGFASDFRDCGFEANCFFPCYGLAEGTLLATGKGKGTPLASGVFEPRELERGRAVPCAEENGRRLASSGNTWNHHEVRIVDPESLRPCADGELGEIWESGASVACGYWNRPDDSERTFRARLADGTGSYLRTGDLGFLVDGQLFVSGRLKDLLIVRGRNHYPQDLERTVEECHPALVPNGVAAFAVEVDGAERVVVACEVRRESLRGLDVEVVVARIRQSLAEEHEVELHSALLLKPSGMPRTSSGKIQRHQCKAGYLGQAELPVVGEWRRVPVRIAEGARDLRQWLVERCAAVVGVAAARIDTRQPFSSFGIDSKEAVALSGELQELLGRTLPPTLVYDYPNIEALVEYLEGGGNGRQRVTLARTSTAGIAIVGIGCRFPRAANPEQFWQLLRDGVDAITPRRPNAGAEAPGDVLWAGYLDEVDRFDAEFFGISGREAELMDPQQRLLLEVAWEAVEHAGVAPRSLAGTRTGVFVGISNLDYLRLQGDSAAGGEPHSPTGNALSIAANRISYVMDLRGPSWAVDTACSSSLVAVHQACRSLAEGECNLALAGGVNLILAPQLHQAFSRAGMLSPNGRAKTFDADADGYVRGEGCGMVVLKRLDEAVRDGNSILAVVRGSAVTQDGRSNGLTAPNGHAQQVTIAQALSNAGVEPREIGYVEAHGTGTPLGDPIEINSLTAELGRERGPVDGCWIGSVKTNIGHLESAAGIAGLIKAVLALRHETIPPHLHLRRLNPHIRIEGTPFAIPAGVEPWLRGEKRRLAGVSSFGFGGTNAHVVIEEAPVPAVVSQIAESPLHLPALSARTPAALDQLCGEYARWIEAHPESSPAEIAFSASAGRTHFEYRRALVAGSTAGWVEQLKVAGSRTFAREPRIAFLFTGQGSQYAGMGRELFEKHAGFRAQMERCAAILQPMLDVLYGNAGRLLDETRYAQPALFALEYSLAKLWMAWGITPAAVAGHSVGELAAACVAGCFSLEDGLRLTCERGRLMQEAPGAGAMLSVFAAPSDLKPWIERHASDLAIAAMNGSRHTVISGSEPVVRGVEDELRANGISSRRLNTSHAFHSPLMREVPGELAQTAAGIAYRAPVLAGISTVTGRAVVDEWSRADYWTSQILSPVRFSTAMETLAGSGIDVFLEVGPTSTLTAMGRDVVGGERSWVASLQPNRGNWESMLHALAEIYERGAEVNWQAFPHQGRRERLPVPTYPFQRRRYWFTNDPDPAVPANVGGFQFSLMFFAASEDALSRDKYRLVLESAKYADRHGFASVWVPERHFTKFGCLYPNPAVLHAALATATQRIRLNAGSVVAPIHNPIRIAEEWAMVDNLSEGRVGISFAAGWNPDDFVFFPERYDDRVSEMMGAVHTVQKLWRGESLEAISGNGKAIQVKLQPTPVQPELPVWLTAAGNPNTFIRAGEIGANLLTHVLDQDEEQLAQKIALYRQARADHGFDPAAGRVTVMLHTFVGDDAARVREQARRPFCKYIKGNFGLLRGLAQSRGQNVDVSALSERDRDEFVEFLYERFASTRGLIGTPESCLDLIGRLERIGVNEVACLLDFGPSVDQILNNLPHLFRLKQLYESKSNVPATPVVAHPTVPKRVTTEPQVACYGRSWDRLATRVEALQADGRWLVVSDGGPLGEHFVTKMRGGRQTCVLVAPNRLDRATIDGPWTGVVDLASSAPIESKLHLLQSLQSQSHEPRPRLWLVTSGAMPVAGSACPGFAQAPLWGLGRAMAIEHAALWGGLIDLEPDAAAELSASHLISAIAATDGEDMVAFRGADRYVPRLVRSEYQKHGADLRFSPEATYLITGGTGGLGRKVSQWLAQRGAGHLVLVGRSPLTPDGVEAVKQIEAANARVHVLQADVAVRQDMERVFERIASSMPALRGIFHLAGVLADRSLVDESPESFRRAAAVKIEGARNLHELSSGIELDHFVLFSSVASLVTMPGQGNYAAANAFLDALAHFRRSMGRPALSVNWGPWAAVGHAATSYGRNAHQRLAQMGIRAMPSEIAIASLERLMQGHAPQAAVVDVDWNRFFEADPAAAQSAFFSRLAPLKNRTHRTQSDPTLIARLTALPKRERKAELRAFLTNLIGSTLKLDAAAIPTARGLFDLGLDSILALELKGRLENSIGKSLRATFFFTHPTIDSVVDYLIEDLWPAEPEQVAPTATQATSLAEPEDDLARLIAEEIGMTRAARQ